jgi:hypothetical protein
LGPPHRMSTPPASQPSTTCGSAAASGGGQRGLAIGPGPPTYRMPAVVSPGRTR